MLRFQTVTCTSRRAVPCLAKTFIQIFAYTFISKADEIFEALIATPLPCQPRGNRKFWAPSYHMRGAPRCPSMAPSRRGHLEMAPRSRKRWPLIKDPIYISGQTSNIQVFYQEWCQSKMQCASIRELILARTKFAPPKFVFRKINHILYRVGQGLEAL